jgi:uncharacterized caspase-like protein
MGLGLKMLRILAVIACVFFAGAASAERRVALVMGADDYRSVRKLDNAINDARSVEQTLQKLGFEVTLETDRDLRRMRRALEDFRDDAAGADVALVFFAGHGVEISGENRLLPVDADASSIDALKGSSLPLEEVRQTVAAVAKIGLIVLDACRNDPFGVSSADGRGVKSLAQVREIKPGLGRIGRAENILFAFSAAPGQTAQDGTDGHSPFTTALAKYLGTDGLEIRSVLTLVQQQVYDLSRGNQLPYVESGLPRLFFASTAGEQLPERERLLLAMADVTPDIRAEVEQIASDADMPLAPLYGALISSDATSLDTTSRAARLREAAGAFVKVRAEMKALASDDPEVTQLRHEAEDQLSLGAFDTAKATLAKAASIDGTSRQALKTNFIKRTLSEAATVYVSGNASAAKGDLLGALKSYQEAAGLYGEVEHEALPADDQHRRIVLMQAIAETQVSLGMLVDALDSIDLLTAAARQRIAGDPKNAGWQHDLSVGLAMNGDLRVSLGDLAGALSQYEQSRDIARTAVALDPSTPEWQRNLAVVLNKIGDIARVQGDLRSALASYREGVAIFTRLIDADPFNAELQRDLSFYYNQIGDVLRVEANPIGALQAFRAARDIRKRLLDTDPADPHRQFDMGLSEERVADMLAEAGDLAGALDAYSQRHRIITMLVERSPENTSWQRDLSVSHEKLGDLQRQKGDSTAALVEYRASHAIMVTIAAIDPADKSWQRDLTISHRKIGEMLQATGDVDAALVEFRAGFTIAEELASSNPDNLDWQFDLATAHSRIADVEAVKGDKGAALADYRASRDIVERLSKTDPSNADWQWNLFASRYQLAQVGDEPVANLDAGVKMLEALAADGRLSETRRPWLETARKALIAARQAAAKPQ